MKCKMLLYSDIAGPAFLPHPERSGESRPLPSNSTGSPAHTTFYPFYRNNSNLTLSLPDGAILPDDRTVTLLATENCTQLLVTGYGLYMGKKANELS